MSESKSGKNVIVNDRKVGRRKERKDRAIEVTEQVKKQIKKVNGLKIKDNVEEESERKREQMEYEKRKQELRTRMQGMII